MTLNARLLVTGFGPFDDHSQNPSGDLACMIGGTRRNDVEISGCVLDVSWKRAWPALQRAVEETVPIGLLCLGLAPDLHVRIEMMAKNVVWPFLDCDRIRPGLSTLRLCTDIGAPTAYWSTWPVEQLARDLQKRTGLPVDVSSDAGVFLCNYVFYLASHHLKDRVRWIGFVHLPPYAQEKERGWTRAQLEAALEGLLDLCTEVIAAELPPSTVG